MDKRALVDKIKLIEGLTYDEKADLIGLLRSHKKYGLVWEEKAEDVEERLREKLPVLTEVKERAIVSDDADAPNHILIEGDNLEALTALTYSHEGKIDVIYIDPPYNTGNKDFVYNDSYVDSEDSYRHSKWLSFMHKRLKIAKRLLSINGMIFISIDDNEQSQLKVLCDEVFTQNNYINTISIKAKSSSGASGGGEDKKLKKNIEYLLIYAKDRDQCNIIFPQKKRPLIELIEEKRENGISWLYTNIMYKKGIKNFIGTTKAGNGEDIKLYKVTSFVIKTIKDIIKEEKLTEEEVYNKYINSIFTTENAQTSIRQRVIDAVGNNDDYYIAEYIPISGRNKGNVIEVGFIGTTKRLISYLKVTSIVENNKVYKLEKIGTLWDDLSWSSVSNEGGITFPAGKKPISLMKRVISMHPSKSAYILDFFAGSASTSHSVMDLNEIDGGNRKAIAITNNENNICIEKSYPRCKNVILGYNKKEGLKRNTLRYYQTELLPREHSPKNMRELMSKATDLLCIKEDLYTEQPMFGRYKTHPKALRYFADAQKQMLILYREEFIPEIVEEIKGMDFGGKKLKIYLYSPGHYAFEDDFFEVQDKVELIALPSAIYKAYKEVLPKAKDKLIELANEETTEGGTL